jgi:hypothetical protein
VKAWISISWGTGPELREQQVAVETPTQQKADGHVGDEGAINRDVECTADCLEGLGLGRRPRRDREPRQ